METINTNPGILKNENEGKRTRVTVEINGIPLEAEKYYFEYPKHIQKETGILGYERTIISNEQMNKYNLENDYDKTRSFLMRMSNDQYPKQTMNHTVGSNANKEDRHKYEENLIKDRFFLQEIFDVDLTGKVTLDNRQDCVDRTDPIILDIYNKNTNEFIEKIKLKSLHEKKREIKENSIYLVGNDAFNTSPGHFYFGSDYQFLSFGFSPKDIFLKEYIQKSYKFILENVKKTYKLGPREGIRDNLSAMYKAYALGNDELINGLGTKRERPEIVEKSFQDIYKEICLDLGNVFESSLKTAYEEDGDGPHDPFIFLDSLAGTSWMMLENNVVRKATSGSKSEDEITIPIFINNDNIPQLSWGHAKYAHFVNQKGFNYIEFKHADHLPVKEEPLPNPLLNKERAKGEVN